MVEEAGMLMDGLRVDFGRTWCVVSEPNTPSIRKRSFALESPRPQLSKEILHDQIRHLLVDLGTTHLLTITTLCPPHICSSPHRIFVTKGSACSYTSPLSVWSSWHAFQVSHMPEICPLPPSPPTPTSQNSATQLDHFHCFNSGNRALVLEV